ncbi:chromosome partition protein Smc [Methylocaldum marinum]|uniref:Chromosome partition protein Smc n=1 Tax=Methylocaldum marinum TaxID=1432792 RepID=A0A250KSN9_9GAMM|nr:chromosome segregation protein SMC [Methylocaldum marinum]BBA34556.1 chromosome partition protein Smc [Methylocaldum marinum]
MRLDKIKLAGFKSFVDPTSIPLPGNLVGIVGPNGCGKSNIIDAVRWVMGESSARHLRGDTMADVIFNGSSTRKPVGLASVELIFDNGEGKAPGEFAKYREISIKRQVTRDGQSTYLLNGARCRRKDITDLFLGTGLGSRSYAIIEQGTISRLIEAKPDELREIIEEAAGISKYKERRHETELRMGHTQENLDRLQDLRDEVAKQLANLQRQAKKAEKYTALKQEERRYKEQLLAIRWRRYDELLRDHQKSLAASEQLFKQLVGEDNRLNASLEQYRDRHEALQHQLGEHQGRYYELGAEISRLDQTIKHARKTRETLIQEQARLHGEKEQALNDLENDKRQIETVREELAAVEVGLEQALAAETEAVRHRDEADRALRNLRQAFESLSAEINRFKGQAEIQRSRMKQLEHQERQLQSRRERLEAERADLETTVQTEGLEELQQELAELEAERATLHERLQSLSDRIREERDRAKARQDELNACRAEVHGVQGKISSLETLQQHAMGKDRAAIRKWLAERDLDNAARLAEHLDVSPGWETAVERVLGSYLEALCVEGPDFYWPHLDGLPGESLGFFETRSTDANGVPAAEKLIAKVQSPWDLGPLLGAVYCADDLAAAKALSERLADHESVVTADGIHLGRGWLAVRKPDDGKAGMIKRERDLRELKARRDGLLEKTRALEQDLAEADQAVKDAEHEREHLQAKERSLGADQARLKAEASAAAARCEQAAKRLRQLEHELVDLEENQSQAIEETAEARTGLIEAEERLAELEPKTADHAVRREELEVLLGNADTSLQAARDGVHELKTRLETLKSAEGLTRKHLERAQHLYDQSLGRLETVSAQMSEAETPVEEEQARLDELSEQRVEVERALSDLRKRSGELEAETRRIDEARIRNQRDLENLKQRLEQAKLELQANEVRRQTVQEQFEELGAVAEAVLAELPDDADEKIWQKRVAELGEEIIRLGAVNLTAMEEYLAQSERMKFLDQQHQDLTESLATLREAIEKIDRECRTRFKETFDRVNAGLQRMFPKLFGGGQASLDLTERDLLHTGVSIMARPPGKRNSSIHLLSGGEKALTAVALVFAIFELNPAPFCLLDEVDAPLDDANVGRFSQLVKEMSEKVQFLFISHNKVTMEIAQHLAGVTMKEPGVSRIVAVDIDAAVEMSAV